MNQTNNMLLTLGEAYGFSVDAPEQTQQLKVSGMKFQIRTYHARGLGHVSAMIASGFFGLMKMDTLIINPTEVDMPLFSYDRVLAMGNDTLIFELYDTFLEHTDMSALDEVKKSAAYLPDHDLGEHWYDSIKLSQSLSKKGKKSHSPAFDTTATHYLAQFLATAKNAPACDADRKREKAFVYVEGLLKNGGPSTDVFKKGIGDEKTGDLFRRVLFGTIE
jgi:hypothetical protein